MIRSKEDFVSYVGSLVSNMEDDPQAWENKDLKSFLEAIASWTEAMDGYYKNNNLPIPENVSWKVFAEILTAARIYE